MTDKAAVPISVLRAAQRLAPDESSVGVVGCMIIAAAEQGRLKATTASVPTGFPLLASFPIGGGGLTFNRSENTRRAEALRRSMPKTVNGDSAVDFEEVCQWWVSINRTVPERALALLCDETRSQLSKGKDRSEAAQAAADHRLLKVIGLIAEVATQYLPRRMLHEGGALNEAQMVEAMLGRLNDGEDVGPWGLGKTTLRKVLADARQVMRGVTVAAAKKRVG